MKIHIHTLTTMVFICLTITMSSCLKDEFADMSEIRDQDHDGEKATVDDNYTYQIPIIFHILYKDANNESQYLPEERFSEIIKNVNEIYEGGIYGQSENMKIKFVLASANEKGKKLSKPGLDYIHYDDSYPIDPNSFMADTTGKSAKYIWDPNDYINVMVYKFADKDYNKPTLGLSSMPYTIEGDSALEGLVRVTNTAIQKSSLNFAYCISLDSKYAYYESSRYNLPDKGKSGYYYDSSDINVTLAHELGHYLGLFNVYAEENNDIIDDCTDTDYCKDTPSYNKIEYDNFIEHYKANINYDNWNFNDFLSRNNCEGKTFNSTNVMDSNIGLGYNFTADQKRRVRNVLYNSPLIPGPKKKSVNSTAQKQQSDSGEANISVVFTK